MKRHKRLLTFVCIVLAVLLLNAVVITANNRITKRMERELLEFPVPPETEIIDLQTITGRIMGNGNGMQYRAILLIQSNLPLNDLKSHYAALSTDEYYVFVAEQASPVIYEGYEYAFRDYPIGETCFMVEMYRDSVVGCEETLWESLLNSDLRGH